MHTPTLVGSSTDWHGPTQPQHCHFLCTCISTGCRLCSQDQVGIGSCCFWAATPHVRHQYEVPDTIVCIGSDSLAVYGHRCKCMLVGINGRCLYRAAPYMARLGLCLLPPALLAASSCDQGWLLWGTMSYAMSVLVAPHFLGSIANTPRAA